MKKNSKISQFSRFLLSSKYAIQVKIWKWLKFLNSVPFIKKTLVNHLYIWIWSFWPTFTALQWRKTNFEISQFSRFLLRSEYAIQVKIWKWLKLLNSVQFFMKTLSQIKLTFEFDHFDWLSKLYSEWRKTSKLVNLKISAKVRVCDFGQNLKMTKTSQFSSIHQQKTLVNQVYIRTWSFWLTFTAFTVNDEKL